MVRRRVSSSPNPAVFHYVPVRTLDASAKLLLGIMLRPYVQILDTAFLSVNSTFTGGRRVNTLFTQAGRTVLLPCWPTSLLAPGAGFCNE